MTSSARKRCRAAAQPFERDAGLARASGALQFGLALLDQAGSRLDHDVSPGLLRQPSPDLLEQLNFMLQPRNLRCRIVRRVSLSLVLGRHALPLLVRARASVALPVPRLPVPWIGKLGHDPGAAVLLDDRIRAPCADHQLDLDVLMAGSDDEANACASDVLVLTQGEADPFKAVSLRAFADELILVESAHLNRFLLDRLIHGAEDDLILGETLFAALARF